MQQSPLFDSQHWRNQKCRFKRTGTLGVRSCCETRASLLGVTTLPAVGSLGARACVVGGSGVWARLLRGMQGEAVKFIKFEPTQTSYNSFAMASSDSDNHSFIDIDDCPDPESELQAADEDEAADVHNARAASAKMASAEIEPNSVWHACPWVGGYLTDMYCDVDQVVFDGYDISDISQDFPGSNFEFCTTSVSHRGLTGGINTAEAEGPHGVSDDTDLLFGKLDTYQVICRHMSNKKREAVKKYMCDQLSQNKELFAGFVSPNQKPGVVVRKGCVVTVEVFRKLCFGCGVRRVSLGRYGQKTPWALFETSLDDFGSKSQSVNIDLAFSFPVIPDSETDTAIPLFSYPQNVSRTSLMFHNEGRFLLNGKPVDFGMVKENLPALVNKFLAPHRVREKEDRKDTISVYPNFYHAVRDRLNFEHSSFPANILTKRKRVQKLKDVASGLKDTLENSEHRLGFGRVEVALVGLNPMAPVGDLAASIAGFMLKRIAILQLSQSLVIHALKRVLAFPDVVGTNADKTTTKDNTEIAVLSNLVGIWNWKYKEHLVLGVYATEDVEFVNGDLPVVSNHKAVRFYKLDYEERDFLYRNYPCPHPRTSSRWVYRVRKVTKRKRAVPSKPVGSFDSRLDVCEEILKWAEDVGLWHRNDPQKWDWRQLEYDHGLVSRNQPPDPLEDDLPMVPAASAAQPETAGVQTRSVKISRK